MPSKYRILALRDLRRTYILQQSQTVFGFHLPWQYIGDFENFTSALEYKANCISSDRARESKKQALKMKSYIIYK